MTDDDLGFQCPACCGSGTQYGTGWADYWETRAQQAADGVGEGDLDRLPEPAGSAMVTCLCCAGTGQAPTSKGFVLLDFLSRIGGIK